MTSLRLAALVLTALFLPAASAPRWIHLRSPHFEMYSTAPDRDARDTLRYFEQVRDFFVQAMSGAPPKELPVVVVAFSSKKEYEPYRFNEFATAYYHGTSRRDYIVLSQAGPDSFPTATHEYVHLFVRHAGLKLPPWLSEGLAEFYSTLKPVDGKVLVGGLIEGRRQALLRDPWVPLATILAADQRSPLYNDKHAANGLYNEGWALTHMLLLSPDYRAGFSRALGAIVAGEPSADVLTEVFGKSLAQIEHDLQNYMRGDRFRAATFPIQIDKAKQEIPASPAALFDVDLTLAELVDRPGNEEIARGRYAALVSQDPKRPEPVADLGFLAERRRDREQARDDFAKAYALGNRDPELLWHYGLLVQRSDMPQSIAALSELLRQQPDRVDARLALAAVQLASHQPADTLQTLSPIHKVPPNDASRFFSMLAHAQQQTGDLKSARENARHLADIASDATERADADRLLQYLDALATPDRPRPPRYDPPPLKAPVPSEPLSTLRGSFVQFDCSGAQARVVVDSGGRRKVFLIDKPGSIDTGGPPVDFSCGAQDRALVEIGFLPPGDRHPGVDGLLRAFRFVR